MKKNRPKTNSSHPSSQIFNTSKRDVEIDLTFVDMFRERVECNPDSIAVVYGQKELTYGELDLFSDYLAHDIQQRGFGKGSFVGLFMMRSTEMVISLLGILKSGAAYVPIDPKYPMRRIRYILSDSNIDLVLTDTGNAATLKGIANIGMVVPDDKWFSAKEKSIQNLNAAPSPADLAYVIYTSGSTGNPKGVMNTHAALLNYLTASLDYLDVDAENSGCFAHLSLSFDASITEIFLPLLFGELLVLSKETGLDIFKDSNLSKYAPYDFIKLTPSHIALLAPVLRNRSGKRLAFNYILGGEALYDYHLACFRELDHQVSIINEYGPTEATVGCCIYGFDSSQPSYKGERVPIGMPIENSEIYVLDERLLPRPDGEIGEICIGGKGLAKGYLHREDLTSEKFCANPFVPETRMYRTGDLGRRLPDGNLEFLGRRDEQVKINGHRIELGEIEAALTALAQVERAAVTVEKSSASVSLLVAYLRSGEDKKGLPGVREALLESLPEFMLPSKFVWVDDFPLTPNGKIDKKKLASPKYERPASAPALKNARTELEKQIVHIWCEELQIPAIGINDNFFEMGGTSLLTLRVNALINERLKLDVPVTKMYQYPTIGGLSAYIESDESSPKTGDFPIKPTSKNTTGDIAVIAMAGRFPGAESIDELWEILSEGKETISFFTPGELDGAIAESQRNDPLYVGARGIVPSAATFDAGFFGLNPKLAKTMDPQLRLLLEICWEALEKSGHLPKHYEGSIGVYAGTGTNTYFKNNVLPNTELLNQIGLLQANTLNDKDYIASRTAYHLNLKGPAVSVHSACSTSLLAVAEAVEAIRSGQCDVALAGGSSVTAPIYSGHVYQEGSILSPDGHCRPFDADAKGTVFSDGAGVVLLKSLEAAKNDGDTIYGIIKGVGINNDGGNKGSFTAPSVAGQADAISRAFRDAQVSPSTIGYLEAHGTATPLGDPIEIEGLHKAFGKQERNNYCALGSIKGNTGHMTAAAGVAGLIKSVLAMNHRQIPPSLGYTKPNPAIDFENSPFFVNSTLRDWDSDKVLRAGISSFGVGGTNVHIVIEEFEAVPKTSGIGRPLQLLAWSAKTETSRADYGRALGNFLKADPKLSLADMAFSLNLTRDAFHHRSFVLGESTGDTADHLLSPKNKATLTSVLKVLPKEIVFLFPGQGAQYIQMGRALYTHEAVFKDAVDTCADLLLDGLKSDIRTVLFPDTDLKGANMRIKDTRYTQPAMFVIEYALSQLWMSWGISPSLFCGHSIGEFVGAHLAGIFSLKDALHLIATRGRLVGKLPEGSMVSVRLPEDALKALLPDNLSIAAVNSDRSCVVSGMDGPITDFIEILDEREVPNSLLATSHAFHSNMMDAALEPFEKAVRSLHLSPPTTPVVSTVTGKLLTDAQATDPEYWTNHLRDTVRFSDAMDTILKSEDSVLLEVGPGHTLTTLTRQKKAARSTTVLSSLPGPKNGEDTYPSMLTALGKLWLAGVEPDWRAFYSGQSRQRIVLPSYAFDRKPCWINPLTPSKRIEKTAATAQKESLEQPDAVSAKNEVGPQDRKYTLLQRISEVISNASGIELETGDYDLNFLEIGLDSLILTQIATTCKKEFDIPITFRQLNEELETPELLAAYLDRSLPLETEKNPTTQETEKMSAGENALEPTDPNVSVTENKDATLTLILQELQELKKQIQLLQNNESISGKIDTEEHPILTHLFRNPADLDPLKENNEKINQKPLKDALPLRHPLDSTETAEQKSRSDRLNTPPMVGAKLGRDENGNPAWFIAHNKKAGEYVKIDLCQ